MLTAVTLFYRLYTIYYYTVYYTIYMYFCFYTVLYYIAGGLRAQGMPTSSALRLRLDGT